MIISLIAGYYTDSDGKFVIGKDNKLPWGHLPEDMRWFKECTLNKPVVMGRKTYESIGRVLPKRENFILSSNPSFNVKGAHTFQDPEKLLGALRPKFDEVFIIGGQQLYEYFIDKAQRLYITNIIMPIALEGDTFFPKWDKSKFKNIHTESVGNLQDYKLTFQIFERNPGNKSTTPSIPSLDPSENSSYFSSMGTDYFL